MRFTRQELQRILERRERLVQVMSTELGQDEEALRGRIVGLTQTTAMSFEAAANHIWAEELLKREGEYINVKRRR